MISAVPNFHTDPARSYTLPGRYYFDHEIYQKENSAIFSRTWQYVGHISMLTDPGDYIVAEIGGESIVILLNNQKNLQAFYNVCQHRAHRLLEGRGHISNRIVCPYHTWTYTLDGDLHHARGTDQLPEFDKSRFGLKDIRVDTLCGFIFVNLDTNAVAFSDAYPGLEMEIHSFSPHPENLKCAYRKEYGLKANWKNSVENFSECYHCPNQHKSLSRQALDMESYRITVHDTYHSHRSKDKGELQGYAVSGDKAGNPNEFGGWLIWPNVSLEVFPGGNLNIFHHIPVSPEETMQVVEWYFPDDPPTTDEQAVIDFMTVVREEDIPICESVQKGLHSRGYTQGRFVINDKNTYLNEHAVHHFQSKVIKALET